MPIESGASGLRRVLFTNFTGLGNGIAASGLFRALDASGAGWTYYHNECPALDQPWFRSLVGLTGFGGLYPAAWRRFNEGDWPAIRAFIAQHRIDAIVSLRNEGPARDTGYAAFKRMFQGQLTFADLDHRYELGSPEPYNLFAQHYGLLRAMGVPVQFRHDWLQDACPVLPGPETIVLVPGSSQAVKNWPLPRWRALAEQIHTRCGSTLVVVPGVLPHEVALAEQLAADIHADCPGALVRMARSRDLRGLIGTVQHATVVVSNDTACVHVAAALGVPAVGLYFSTNGTVWGGLSPVSVQVQSLTGLSCREQKPGAGNCMRFHTGCDAPCKGDVTVPRVFRAFLDVLSAGPARVRQLQNDAARAV